MRFTKKFSLLLVVLLLIATLAGCGTGSKTNTTGNNTTTPTSAPSSGNTSKFETNPDGTLKAPDKEMTITLWDIATEEPNLTIQQGAVDRFMADHPHIKVETTHIQNDTYKQRLVIAMSSGMCPDMYMHWGGGPMNEYIEAGFAVPITDLMKNYCKVKFLDAAIAQSSYKGEIYAVPYGGLAGSGFFYNKSIFKKLGLEVPKTIAQLEEVCEILKKNNYIPFSLANQNKWTGSMYFMYLVARYGGVEEFEKAVAGTGSFESEAFQFAAETIQKWVRNGYFPEGVNSLNADDGQDRQLMYTEQAAMMLHGSWQAASMNADNSEWYKENIDYFPFPVLDGSKADQSIVVGTSIGNGFSFNTGDDMDKLIACFVLATQYYNDETYNKQMVEAGHLPSIEGIGDTITDHCMKKVWADFSSATNVQLWYDQYLPPAVGEVHKNTCQELFGLTMTPQEANRALQDAMVQYLQEKNSQ